MKKYVLLPFKSRFVAFPQMEVDDEMDSTICESAESTSEAASQASAAALSHPVFPPMTGENFRLSFLYVYGLISYNINNSIGCQNSTPG